VCTGLTQLYLLVEYKVFSTKVQLHVSALGNGHLQVVHEILIKKLYKTYMGLCIWGRVEVKWTRELVSVRGWAV